MVGEAKRAESERESASWGAGERGSARGGECASTSWGAGERGSASLAPKPRATSVPRTGDSGEYWSAILRLERYCERAPAHYLYHGLSDCGPSAPTCESGDAHDSTSTCED